jgi:hypothetical protein
MVERQSPLDRSRWLSRSNLTLLAFLAIAGFFLWTEHRAHVLATLPYVLLLGCIFMHFFMHGGHGHGGDHDQGVGERQS